MLCSPTHFCGTVDPQTYTHAVEGNSSYGHSRRMPTVQVPQIPETWSHSQRHTEPSLPRLWAPIRPVRRAIPHRQRQTWAYRTLTGGTAFVTRHLSCRGRHPQVALGFSGPMLRGLA